MKEPDPISNEVMELVKNALQKGECWIAYNHSLYFIDKNDIQFFKTEAEAKEFACNNISDSDHFYVMPLNSISDLPGSYFNSNAITGNLESVFNKSEQAQLFTSQLKSDNMNADNFQYLSDNVKYMGFGENLKSNLERNMREGKPEFQLHFHAEVNKKPFEATLNFRKSDSSDMYFFNNYHASLERNNGEKVEQTFYLNKGKGVTGKEAFNLLDGRSVHKDLVTKEGQPYKAWMQLDFENKDKNNNFEVKQYHENYGYNLKEAVEKFAVADLKDPEKEQALMQSLQKGNIQSVSIEKEGNSHKMFMEADPQFKKVNLFDSDMKLVTRESLGQYQPGKHAEINSIKTDLGEDKKKEVKMDMKPGNEKPAKKNDTSLLPKKREHKKKGLGVS